MWPALSVAMSDKPVSIEPTNAGEDKTKSEVELVAKQKTIAPVWKHFGFEADEKGKPRSPDRPKCTCVNMKWHAKIEFDNENQVNLVNSNIIEAI